MLPMVKFYVSPIDGSKYCHHALSCANHFICSKRDCVVICLDKELWSDHLLLKSHLKSHFFFQIFLQVRSFQLALFLSFTAGLHARSDNLEHKSSNRNI